MKALVSKLEDTCQNFEETPFEAGKVRWRKALAIGLAGLGMAAAPMTGKAAGSAEQWDAALNRTWGQLTPKQRQELRQDEHTRTLRLRQVWQTD